MSLRSAATECLETLSTDTNNGTSVSDAGKSLSSLSNGGFMVSFCVAKRIGDLKLPVGIMLQTKKED